ncbi:unnamed protein product [Rotaria socialis]|uniref:Uncharacterized protein n=1 Tax=Rotaria socialis TaxID=392032 RepID=A0A821JZC2_9BILA|nr:unnamed protein product [Rotaria socialis]
MDRSNFYNITHLSVSFFFIFTSYSVAQTFQTSSDYAKSGAFAIGIIYLLICVSNAGLSAYIIRLLGVRLTLILSSITYALFIACNIRYNIWSLYICAFLLGFGAALLWTAQGVYVTISTNKHEQINNLVQSSTRGFMNGMFFGVLQLNQIVGNLIASFLFRLKFDQWILFTIMTVISGLGTISLLFVRPIELPKTTGKTLFLLLTISNILCIYIYTYVLEKQSILSSLSIIRDPRFALLIPTMCYSGLAQGFIYATVPPLIFDKSQKFLVFAILGGVNALNSLFFGKLSDLFPRRVFIFAFGAFAHLIIFGLLLLLWKPPLDQNRIEIFIILIIGLSIGDTIYTTLIYSVMGIFYAETRPADAFACLKIFVAGATAIGFIEQVLLTIPMQILCLILSMLVSIMTLIYEHYFVVSIDTGKSRKPIEQKNKEEVEVEIEEQLLLTTLSIKA